MVDTGGVEVEADGCVTEVVGGREVVVEAVGTKVVTGVVVAGWALVVGG
jgi:hypothetical protein